jgi:hypothetical protein
MVKLKWIPSLTFGLFVTSQGIISMQHKGSESDRDKSAVGNTLVTRKISDDTAGPDLTQSSEALPSQRNNPNEGAKQREMRNSILE